MAVIRANEASRSHPLVVVEQRLVDGRRLVRQRHEGVENLGWANTDDLEVSQSCGRPDHLVGTSGECPSMTVQSSCGCSTVRIVIKRILKSSISDQFSM
jgi:hypothetical protein